MSAANLSNTFIIDFMSIFNIKDTGHTVFLKSLISGELVTGSAVLASFQLTRWLFTLSYIH